KNNAFPLDTPHVHAYNAIGSLRDAALANTLDARHARGGSMNKQDLIAKIAKDADLSKAAAAAAVDSFIDGITRALKKGDPVTFVGFGTFKTTVRKARTGRNPQTGAAVKIPKRRVVRFTAGKALKAAIK